jgi:hypothetical protein
MVGDILDDIEAGRRAGCRTVLLDVGHETEWRLSGLRLPHLVAPNLLRAAAAMVDADRSLHIREATPCNSLTEVHHANR